MYKSVSQKELETIELTVNKKLANEGSRNRISLEKRPGQYAVDLYDDETSVAICNLVIGTRKEVYLYLAGVDDWLRIKS